MHSPTPIVRVSSSGRNLQISTFGAGGPLHVSGVEQKPDPADLDHAIADYGTAILLDPILKVLVPSSAIDLTQPVMWSTTILASAAGTCGIQENCNVSLPAQPLGTWATAIYPIQINLYAAQAAVYNTRYLKAGRDADAAMTNLDGVISDYTDAMRVEPQAIKYYSARGDTYLARAHLFDGKNDLPHAIADYQAAIADYTKSQSISPTVDVGAPLKEAQSALARDNEQADIPTLCNKCVAYCQEAAHSSQCPPLSAAQPSSTNSQANRCFLMYQICLGISIGPCGIGGHPAISACTSVIPGIARFAPPSPCKYIRPSGGAATKYAASNRSCSGASGPEVGSDLRRDVHLD